MKKLLSCAVVFAFLLSFLAPVAQASLVYSLNSLTITPDSPSILQGLSQQFTVTVTGSNVPAGKSIYLSIDRGNIGQNAAIRFASNNAQEATVSFPSQSTSQRVSTNIVLDTFSYSQISSYSFSVSASFNVDDETPSQVEEGSFSVVAITGSTPPAYEAVFSPYQQTVIKGGIAKLAIDTPDDPSDILHKCTYYSPSLPPAPGVPANSLYCRIVMDTTDSGTEAAIAVAGGGASGLSIVGTRTTQAVALTLSTSKAGSYYLAVPAKVLSCTNSTSAATPCMEEYRTRVGGTVIVQNDGIPPSSPVPSPTPSASLSIAARNSNFSMQVSPAQTASQMTDIIVTGTNLSSYKILPASVQGSIKDYLFTKIEPKDETLTLSTLQKSLSSSISGTITLTAQGTSTAGVPLTASAQVAVTLSPAATTPTPIPSAEPSFTVTATPVSASAQSSQTSLVNKTYAVSIGNFSNIAPQNCSEFYYRLSKAATDGVVGGPGTLQGQFDGSGKLVGCNATASVTVLKDAAAGERAFTVAATLTANGKETTRSADFSLQVTAPAAAPSFSLAVSPSSASVSEQDLASGDVVKSYSFTASNFANFGGSVACQFVTFSHAESGASGSISVEGLPTKGSVSQSDTCTGTFSVRIRKGSSAGNAATTITASAAPVGRGKTGSASASTSITITPAEPTSAFFLTANPASHAVSKGSAVQSVSSLITPNGLPAGVGASQVSYSISAQKTINGMSASMSGATAQFSIAPYAQIGTATYVVTGSYTANGSTKTASVNINVSVQNPAQALSCSLTASPDSGIAPLTSAFSLGASGGTGSYSNYSIDFGDSASASASSASHTYSSEGTYTATGSVSDGTNSATCTTVVDAQPEPDYSISLSPSSDQFVKPGASLSYTLSVSRTKSFNGPVWVKVSGLAAGLKSPYSPELSGSASPAIIPASGDSSQITISADQLAFTGRYSFTVETGNDTIGKYHDVSAVFYVYTESKDPTQITKTGPCGCKIAAKRVSPTVVQYRWDCASAAASKNIFLYTKQGASYRILQGSVVATSNPGLKTDSLPASGGSAQYGIACYADGKDVNAFGSSGGETNAGGR
jgi:hypothetical protein